MLVGLFGSTAFYKADVECLEKLKLLQTIFSQIGGFMLLLWKILLASQHDHQLNFIFIKGIMMVGGIIFDPIKHSLVISGLLIIIMEIGEENLTTMATFTVDRADIGFTSIGLGTGK